MVHFGKTKIEEMCECQYLFTCYILKEILDTILFFLQCYIIVFEKATLQHLLTNTVAHHLIFFTNCCPSEIIVFYFLFNVELEAQVEMQELLDVCYNQYQSAICPLE